MNGLDPDPWHELRKIYFWLPPRLSADAIVALHTPGSYGALAAQHPRVVDYREGHCHRPSLSSLACDRTSEHPSAKLRHSIG